MKAINYTVSSAQLPAQPSQYGLSRAISRQLKKKKPRKDSIRLELELEDTLRRRLKDQQHHHSMDRLLAINHSRNDDICRHIREKAELEGHNQELALQLLSPGERELGLQRRVNELEVELVRLRSQLEHREIRSREEVEELKSGHLRELRELREEYQREGEREKGRTSQLRQINGSSPSASHYPTASSTNYFGGGSRQVADQTQTVSPKPVERVYSPHSHNSNLSQANPNTAGGTVVYSSRSNLNYNQTRSGQSPPKQPSPNVVRVAAQPAGNTTTTTYSANSSSLAPHSSSAARISNPQPHSSSNTYNSQYTNVFSSPRQSAQPMQPRETSSSKSREEQPEGREKQPEGRGEQPNYRVLSPKATTGTNSNYREALTETFGKGSKQEQERSSNISKSTTSHTHHPLPGSSTGTASQGYQRQENGAYSSPNIVRPHTFRPDNVYPDTIRNGSPHQQIQTTTSALQSSSPSPNPQATVSRDSSSSSRQQPAASPGQGAKGVSSQDIDDIYKRYYLRSD